MQTASAKVLGKYRLVAELGRGSLGPAYLAVAVARGGARMPAVVKELSPELAGEEGSLRRFLGEARLGLRLNHPNVVRTYDVGSDGGRHFVAMEYLDGQSLHRTAALLRRRGQAMPRELPLRVVSEALLGLHYAHEVRGDDGRPLGIVHRDLSPRNVILTYDGQVKLVDFGVARALDVTHEMSAASLKGKISYMAPEQVRDGADVDRRADVFGAGALLWEALAGRELWKGIKVNDVLARLARGELPPSPSAFAPGVPPELDRICAVAMAVEREARYPTALAFREALEQYIMASGDGASTPEVGRFVAEAFRKERGLNRALLDAELNAPRAGAGASPWAGAPSGTTPLARPSVRVAAAGGARPSGAPRPGRAGARAKAARPATRSTLLTGAAVVVASAALTAGAVVATRGRLRPARSLASTSPVASRAGAEAALVALDVRVSPAHARVFLDDEELPPGGRAGVRPRDGRTHRLRAEAEGYQPRTEVVVFDAADLTVSLSLDRRPRGAPGPPVRQRVTSPPPAAASSAPPGPPDAADRAPRRGP